MNFVLFLQRDETSNTGTPTKIIPIEQIISTIVSAPSTEKPPVTAAPTDSQPPTSAQPESAEVSRRSSTSTQNTDTLTPVNIPSDTITDTLETSSSSGTAVESEKTTFPQQAEIEKEPRTEKEPSEPIEQVSPDKNVETTAGTESERKLSVAPARKISRFLVSPVVEQKADGENVEGQEGTSSEVANQPEQETAEQTEEYAKSEVQDEVSEQVQTHVEVAVQQPVVVQQPVLQQQMSQEQLRQPVTIPQHVQQGSYMAYPAAVQQLNVDERNRRVSNISNASNMSTDSQVSDSSAYVQAHVDPSHHVTQPAQQPQEVAPKVKAKEVSSTLPDLAQNLANILSNPKKTSVSAAPAPVPAPAQDVQPTQVPAQVEPHVVQQIQQPEVQLVNVQPQTQQIIQMPQNVQMVQPPHQLNVQPQIEMIPQGQVIHQTQPTHGIINQTTQWTYGITVTPNVSMQTIQQHMPMMPTQTLNVQIQQQQIQQQQVIVEQQFVDTSVVDRAEQPQLQLKLPEQRQVGKSSETDVTATDSGNISRFVVLNVFYLCFVFRVFRGREKRELYADFC